MSTKDATDAVLAVLDDAGIHAWQNDAQYDLLAHGIDRAIATHTGPAIAAKDAEIARLREALAPFAAIANHFPLVQIHGGRPYTGTIYAWHSSDIPDAEMTVEHVHAARAALAQVAEVGK